MKYIFSIIFIVTHVLAFSQKQKKVAVYDPDKLELIENKIYTGRDTLVVNKFENGEILSTGKYALNKNGEVTFLKVGHWIQYFKNGNIESEGDFEISSYLHCGPGGLQRVYYCYKIGNWNYYDDLNTVLASGQYVNFNSHINNSCEGGTELIFMKTNEEWIFPLGKSNKLDERVNSALISDGYNEILYYLNRNNDVEWKYN